MAKLPAGLALATLFFGNPATADEGGRESPGQEIYEHNCASCHDRGQLGAPRLGDRKAWRPLIAEGQRMLERTAIRGIRKMPPRGGNPKLTDLEVKRAVAYMANTAGGKFKTYD
jgi:cytochrome c5